MTARATAFLAAALALAPLSALAQPAPELAAIALRTPLKGEPEQWMTTGPLQGVRNVVNPTLTPVLPDPAKATGAAVIVAPGGAFRFLSMDSEGWAVARWLADRGVAAFVLKYRTVPTPRDEAGFGKSLMTVMSGPRSDTIPLDATAEAVEDAATAVRLVRTRATEWKVDTGKFGFVGFSA
jgi:acetyl esterase/lipase